MPIIYSNNSNQKFQLIVSENTEDIEFFMEAFKDKKILSLIETLNPSRKIEILNSHILISHLTKNKEPIQFLKDEFGKPVLIHATGFMSISHSFTRSCAIIAPVDVGIDIQKKVDKINRIKRKFLSDEEFSRVEGEGEIDMLHVMWGAKECLYKAYGKKKVTFKTELNLDAFEYNPHGGTLTGHVKKVNYEASFEIQYQKLDEYYLVFALRTDPILV